MINKVIGWLKANSPSGVLNWEGGSPYPEVTSYLIPTLLKYGETALARQYADWLLKIQNTDGSFTDYNGTKKRSFDTAACYEGLLAIGELEAAAKAKEWLEGLCLDSGALPVAEGDRHTYFYTARASGLIGSEKGKAHWSFSGSWDNRWGAGRVHYIAYGLEGLAMMGVDIRPALIESQKALRDDLMPWEVEWWQQRSGVMDICATCQMAMLYKQHGIDADNLIARVEALISESGGVPVAEFSNRSVSWAAKFYLEAK